MLTKILAAKRAAGSGASTVIAWGREPDVLLRLAAGEAIGTALVAGTAKLAARKQWMVDHLQLRGAVAVDDGAVAKLRDEGKSLLPIGVREVRATSRAATSSPCARWPGAEMARGLANYSAAEARLIARKPSSQIEAAAGLCRRARADPPRQPGAGLTPAGPARCPARLTWPGSGSRSARPAWCQRGSVGLRPCARSPGAGSGCGGCTRGRKRASSVSAIS